MENGESVSVNGSSSSKGEVRKKHLKSHQEVEWRSWSKAWPAVNQWLDTRHQHEHHLAGYERLIKVASERVRSAADVAMIEETLEDRADVESVERRGRGNFSSIGDGTSAVDGKKET